MKSNNNVLKKYVNSGADGSRLGAKIDLTYPCAADLPAV